MRAFLLGLVVVSIGVSAVIWFLPQLQLQMQPPASKKLHGTIPFDTTIYIAQKNVPAKPDTAFAQLLTQNTPMVMGLATESAKPASSSGLKKSYTIAFLGDSMIDTLGPNLPPVQSALKAKYPAISFSLLNYGAASTNIEYGLTRLTNSYTYLGKGYPSLLSQSPDIVVVESFAYNHWENTQSDLDRQWLMIARIIDAIKKQNPKTKIVLAATIAPHCPTYTDGSANLPPEQKQRECSAVKAYLQNMINFATSQHYPLIDAYHASLEGSEGKPLYINADHIHPSNEGKALFSKLLVDTLIEHRVLEE